MNVWSYLALGYFTVVVLGSILLVLPFATKAGEESTNYLDALFTSVSAACVTGLTPFDTGAHWSLFGQIVILILIQLGGLGFMTFVSVLLMAVKGGLGQYERRAILQSFGGGAFDRVKRLITRIFVGTFTFEMFGTALLCIRFIPHFGAQGIWLALFHSVSAFCNAGFDLMGGTNLAAGGSLSAFARDPLVTLTLTVLIIVGGLGFCIWGDVVDCKGNPKKFQFYTKVILIVNSVLLLLGTGLFLLFERDNPSYAGYNFGEKLLTALFNSTTARTAGFYTTDPSSLSGSGSLLMIILMFIGGSSGSTAGGIKVGTFTVILMGMIAALLGRRDITIGKRRIDPKLLGQALAVFAAYLFLILISTMILCAVEPADTAGQHDTFTRALFEVVSAIGTVGLSMGFTPTLSIASKIVLILLMYMGRVGILTLGFALGKHRSEPEVRRPIDNFFIG